MPSASEIKQEMKKTTNAKISKGAVDEMISYYEKFIKESIIEKEKESIDKGQRTIGINPGLSSNKIMVFSRKNSNLKISYTFVEMTKKELCNNFKSISKRADGIAIDHGRKTISSDDIEQAISEIDSSGKYEIKDDDIMPHHIEGAVYRELGVISDESIEVISNHMSDYLNSIFDSIRQTSKGRGRSKGNIKIEDVMDGVTRRDIYE